MAQDYSFDVVSQFDRQELVNAVNQAQREITTRYDFKDTGASIELGEDEITLQGPSDFKLKAMVDVLQSKFVKRNLSLKILKAGPIEPAAKGSVRQKLELQEGHRRRARPQPGEADQADLAQGPAAYPGRPDPGVESREGPAADR